MGRACPAPPDPYGPPRARPVKREVICEKGRLIQMMTKEQYIESLRKLNLNLYMFGKKVEDPVDNPVIRPSLNSFAATYELVRTRSTKT